MNLQTFALKEIAVVNASKYRRVKVPLRSTPSCNVSTTPVPLEISSKGTFPALAAKIIFHLVEFSFNMLIEYGMILWIF